MHQTMSVAAVHHGPPVSSVSVPMSMSMSPYAPHMPPPIGPQSSSSNPQQRVSSSAVPISSGRSLSVYGAPSPSVAAIPHHHHHMSSPPSHRTPKGGMSGNQHQGVSGAAAAAAMMMAGAGAPGGVTVSGAGAGSSSGALSQMGLSSVSEQIKPPKKPEKPMSAYMRYNKRVHEKIKAENPQMKMWDIAKIIGQKWRELPDSEKQSLNEEYEIDKSRYNEEMKAYYNSAAYQSYLQLKNREKQLQEQHHASATASDPRSLLNDSKMTITPAIDDEDLDEDGFGLKHLAATRFRRNNRLLLDVLSDFHVGGVSQSPGDEGVVTVSRLKALQTQVEALIEKEKHSIDELVEMEQKHLRRKRSIEEKRDQFEEECEKLKKRRFNWQTATEGELKSIKGWLRSAYNIDTGEDYLEGTDSTDEVTDKEGSKPQHTAENASVNPESNRESTSVDGKHGSDDSSSSSEVSKGSNSVASSSTGLTIMNADNIASAINTVLQEHPPIPATTAPTQTTPSGSGGAEGETTPGCESTGKEEERTDGQAEREEHQQNVQESSDDSSTAVIAAEDQSQGKEEVDGLNGEQKNSGEKNLGTSQSADKIPDDQKPAEQGEGKEGECGKSWEVQTGIEITETKTEAEESQGDNDRSESKTSLMSAVEEDEPSKRSPQQDKESAEAEAKESTD